MDFTARLAWSVTKYVTYQLRKMTPLHVVLGFVIDEKGTNNLISIYLNRKGCQCIG